ncbi:class I SAM-dependent methyltransferase [Puia dinghuensis]|nr:class I SAM-dependent methyltransferase [Puia dinghuensis]
MRCEEVQSIYDADYANEYNERFLLNPFSAVSTKLELSVIRNLLSEDSRWLDVGCGTGYFLSQFPGVQRAGLDLSPEMLKVALAANPDALFLRQGDFTQAIEEWNASWSLVTCMWTAYNYVDSMTDVERVVANMVAWTRPGGAVFIPVMDLEDLRPNRQLPYEERADVFGGTIYLTGFTWSWREDRNDRFHKHLVAPHIEHFVHLLEPWFDNIEIVRYSPFMRGWVSRKAIVATGKRSKYDDENKAAVRWQPIPPPENDEPKENGSSPLAFISHKQLLGELYLRIRSGSLIRSAARKLLKKQ